MKGGIESCQRLLTKLRLSFPHVLLLLLVACYDRELQEPLLAGIRVGPVDSLGHILQWTQRAARGDDD